MKSTFTPGRGGVNTIQKQHVKVHIEIQRTAESLDQRYRAGLRCLSSESCFLDQVGREGPVHDPQHTPHQFRAAGEQESQLKRKT